MIMFILILLSRMKGHQTLLKVILIFKIRGYILHQLILFKKKLEIDSLLGILFSQLQQGNRIKTQIFLEQKETLKLFKNQQINIKIFDRDNQIHLPDQMLLEMMKLLLSSKMVLCTNQL